MAMPASLLFLAAAASALWWALSSGVDPVMTGGVVESAAACIESAGKGCGSARSGVTSGRVELWEVGRCGVEVLLGPPLR